MAKKYKLVDGERIELTEEEIKEAYLKTEGDMRGERLRSKESEVKMSVPEGLEFDKPYKIEEVPVEVVKIKKLPKELKNIIEDASKHARRGGKKIPTIGDEFFED